jgi:hypothetical protein
MTPRALVENTEAESMDESIALQKNDCEVYDRKWEVGQENEL